MNESIKQDNEFNKGMIKNGHYIYKSLKKWDIL